MDGTGRLPRLRRLGYCSRQALFSRPSGAAMIQAPGSHKQGDTASTSASVTAPGCSGRRREQVAMLLQVNLMGIKQRRKEGGDGGRQVSGSFSLPNSNAEVSITNKLILSRCPSCKGIWPASFPALQDKRNRD